MAPKGKYFVIKNKDNGYVLNVKEGSKEPGTAVLTWKKLDDNDNQVWFRDPFTGTFCNRHSKLSLDFGEDRAIIANKPTAGSPNQQWRYNKDHETFELVSNPVIVIAVAEEDEPMGARVMAAEFTGSKNQKWKLMPLKVDYFYIRTELDDSKVLDISGADDKAGAQVILYEQHKRKKSNQLWYEDPHGNIRSKLSDKFALDASGGEIVLGTFEEGNKDVYWVIKENKIVSKYDPVRVLEVLSSQKHDGAAIGPATYKGTPNQHWVFDSINDDDE